MEKTNLIQCFFSFKDSAVLQKAVRLVSVSRVGSVLSVYSKTSERDNLFMKTVAQRLVPKDKKTCSIPTIF